MTTTVCPAIGPNGVACDRAMGHEGPHHMAAAGTSQIEMARFALGVVAAIIFGFAGLQMVGLKSQSGNTVAELFDNAFGFIAFGLAVLSIALTIPRSRP